MSPAPQSTTEHEPRLEPRSPRAVVLLSGGLDSATTLALAVARGYRTYALTVRYGQRHALELEAARSLAAALGAERHLEIAVDLGAIGGSALTDDMPVPAARSGAGSAGQIPTTYVPARNTILLGLALGWAEVLGAADIFIGVNAVDFSGYPDCRPAFIEAFESLARLATRAGVSGAEIRIHAPLIELSKAEIIRRGTELGVDYGLTLSCYDPDRQGAACGRCEACVLRERGFREAGLTDPARAPKRP